MARENFALLAAIAAGLLLISRKSKAKFDPHIDVVIPPYPLVPELTPDPVAAFTYMIQCAETSPEAVASGDAYRTFYGGSLFSDLSDHPVLTGEKVGVPLSPDKCARAGFGPGCVSTAAGAGQINLPTWMQFREAGPWGPRLEDFEPESQDEAIRRILEFEGAIPLIEAGQIDDAIARVAHRWASLPGSKAGQGGRRRDQLFAWFNAGMGAA